MEINANGDRHFNGFLQKWSPLTMDLLLPTISITQENSIFYGCSSIYTFWFER